MRRSCLIVLTAVELASAATCNHPVAPADSFWYGSDGPLSVTHATLKALRLQAAKASLRLIMDAHSASGRGPLLNISDLVSAFNGAFAAGGARGLIDLLDMVQFAACFQKEHNAIDIPGSVARFAPKAQTGLLYDPAFLVRFGYSWAANISRDDPAVAFVQGGLWWIRHWAGEYLAEQISRHPQVTAADVIWWLQIQQKCYGADFATVAVEHSVIWYTVANEGLIMGEAFPEALTAKWCHRYYAGSGEWVSTVRSDLGRECRHAVGHAVYYWLIMRNRPLRQLQGFASLNYTLRVLPHCPLCNNGVPLESEEIELGMRVCQSASNQHLVADCVNGLAHSYMAMAPVPNETLMAFYDRRGTNMVNLQRTDPASIPAEARPFLKRPLLNYTTVRTDSPIPFGSFKTYI